MSSTIDIFRETLVERTILLTGGTAGIGSRSARGLAGPGTRLLITGRDRPKGQIVAQALSSQTGGRVELLTADLSTLDGARSLASEVRERADHLDVVVNNVGALVGERRVGSDGFETTWSVNHLVPTLLVNELRPVLAHTGRSRVIGLTSSGHRFARIDLANLQGERSYVPMSMYVAAKLAHLMVMSDWAPDLGRDGITVLFADPGGAATAMTADLRSSYFPRWMRPMAPLMRRMTAGQDPGASQEAAARSTIYAASAAELDGAQGAYVLPSTRLGSPSRRSRDQELRRRLHALTRAQLQTATDREAMSR